MAEFVCYHTRCRACRPYTAGDGVWDGPPGRCGAIIARSGGSVKPQSERPSTPFRALLSANPRRAGKGCGSSEPGATESAHLRTVTSRREAREKLSWRAPAFDAPNCITLLHFIGPSFFLPMFPKLARAKKSEDPPVAPGGGVPDGRVPEGRQLYKMRVFCSSVPPGRRKRGAQARRT